MRDTRGKVSRMGTRTGERSRTAADRPTPQRSPEFAHLTLPQLRTYRRALTTEENRVSYWRRLIQARMDLLADSMGPEDGHALDRVRGLLAEVRSPGRTALVEIVPVDDVPPLPDLEGLWAREVPHGDTAASGALRRDLGFAELQLSAYRAALHRRLAAATGELIARYHENPALALTALPAQPAKV